ncbi:hypothetical protein [Prosthecodimorpha staleyi]|uniref:Uncharacterized protein n=1 Tax=Prosthecodimorpha staleyi TaxID=2840188 RepID=A0A947GFV9_9HYPH|nr:hypothetical protein [Prosthecodimorpha staleyi]MBT9293346.1 hypothetical protein [Prosthecodimorpha staleyi]
MTTVPAGIDPGWQTNPGRLRQRARVLAEHLDDALEAADPDLARVAVRDVMAGPAWREHHAAAVRLAASRQQFVQQAEAQGLPKAQIDSHRNTVLRWPEVPMPVGVMPAEIAATRPAAKTVVVAADWSVGHSVGKHPTAAGDWAGIQEMLDRGEVQQEASTGHLSIFLRRAGVEWALFLRALPDHWLVTTLFQPKPSYRANKLARPGQIKVREEDAGGGP